MRHGLQDLQDEPKGPQVAVNARIRALTRYWLDDEAARLRLVNAFLRSQLPGARVEATSA